jgi:hypothetical protein
MFLNRFTVVVPRAFYQPFIPKLIEDGTHGHIRYFYASLDQPVVYLPTPDVLITKAEIIP